MSTVTNNKHANYKRKQADRTSPGAVDWGMFCFLQRTEYVSNKLTSWFWHEIQSPSRTDPRYDWSKAEV